MSDADLEKISPSDHQGNLKETQEPTLLQRAVDGIYNGTNFIQQKIRSGEESLSREDLLELHQLIMNDPANPEKSGVLRTTPALIKTKIRGELFDGHVPPDETFLSEYFNEFVVELGDKCKKLNANTPVWDVLDIATWAHLQFVNIHPFSDGNGRTARLLVDYIFRKVRLPFIKDWGAKEEEYKELVYNSFKNNNWSNFGIFLARKLSQRLSEIAGRFGQGKDYDEFQPYILAKKKEIEGFLD